MNLLTLDVYRKPQDSTLWRVETIAVPMREIRLVERKAFTVELRDGSTNAAVKIPTDALLHYGDSQAVRCVEQFDALIARLNRKDKSDVA